VNLKDFGKGFGENLLPKRFSPISYFKILFIGVPMKITVRKPMIGELEKMGVLKWPTWESPVTKFDWHYDGTETAYFLAGKVIVETPDGEKVQIEKGDIAVFPDGLKCVWNVLEPVRKHYRFD
jgi:uncharacterized protein